VTSRKPQLLTISLKELGVLSQGGTPDTSIAKYWNGSYPFITGADITHLYVTESRSYLTEEGLNSSKTQRCEAGDVLIVSRTRVGRVGVAATTLAVSQDVSVLKLKPIFSPQYVALFLLSYAEELQEASQGATIKGLTRNYLENIRLQLPKDISEQQRLADEIEQRLLAISKMRAAAERQEHAASSLFMAELQGAFSTVKLPESWTYRPISDLIVLDGQQIDSRHPDFNRLPFLGLENIEPSTGRFIIPEDQSEPGRSSCFRFGPKHVLYGKLRPYLNKVYLPDADGRCALEIIPLLPKEGFSREFVAVVLMSPLVVVYATQYSTGGRMPRANIRKLIGLAVPMPEVKDECNRLGARLSGQLHTCNTIQTAVSRNMEAVTGLPAATLREFFNFGRDIHV
jgi:type I restriction enzyme S subunit